MLKRGNVKRFFKWFGISFGILLIIGSIYIGVERRNQVFTLSSLKEVNVDDKEINYLSNDETAKIEKFIEEDMNEGKIPGLSVTIVKDDKTIYQKGFGYSDVEEKKPVNSESLFEIGSNSKAFTALGILSLEKSGQINLNDEVTKYIPWLKVKYKGKEVSITIQQLLNHSSGIPFKSIDKVPVSNEDNALEETVKTLVGIELDSKPGNNFQYATINYDVLGLIIEKVTGMSYEKYMKENVLNLLGLNNTYLDKNEIANKDMTKGYKFGFLKAELYEAPVYRGNKPAGYIISNAEDMAKWLKIQMDTMNELKFDKDIIKKSHEASPAAMPVSDGEFYDSGWFIYSGGKVLHGGNNPNYSSFITFNTKNKVGVVVLSNINSNYVGNIGVGINRILQGELVSQGTKDIYISVDKVAIAIICISSFLVILTLFFMIKALREIFRKQRYFKFNCIKSSLRLIFSFVFMLGLSYCIYLMPQVLYSGVSWTFVFVWLPNSVKIALYLVYVAILLIYVYFIVTSFFKKIRK